LFFAALIEMSPLLFSSFHDQPCGAEPFCSRNVSGGAQVGTPVSVIEFGTLPPGLPHDTCACTIEDLSCLACFGCSKPHGLLCVCCAAA
jgi:hypothetical protein